MSNQIVISSGAKVRDLNGVLTGTSGIVSSVPLGAANGVATLDSGGKVPVSQLPSSVVTYLGTWNAATNTPTLVNGTGDAGDMYICNVAGTVNFGAGPVTFAVGDWVLYGSGTWQKSNGQNGTVTSVAVTESGDALTITGSPITTAGTINIGFAGTSGQYVNGAGGLTTFPSLTGFVPYTGATGAVNLGAFDLTVNGLTVGRGGGSISTNTVLGTTALSSNTTGASNVAIGINSLNTNTTGGSNVAVGQSSLQTNNSNQNTAIGNQAMQFNTTGTANIGVGHTALQNNTTGNNNIAIGYESGINITTGSNNTIIGNYAGTTTLANNIVLADGAGNVRYQFDGTNNIFTSNLNGTSASFASSGGSDTFAINHSSGSGIALNITKGGNGEGLYINKTSGTGNAATIIGTLNATTLVKSGGTSSQYLMADGSTSTLTNPVTGTGTTNYLPKFTGASTIGNSGITDDGTTVTYGSGSGLKQIYINGGGYDLILGASGGGVFGFTSTNISLVFSTTSKPLGIGTNAAQPLIFGTSAAERMRLDASGNLGLGVTPSAWSPTLAKAIQVGNLGSSIWSYTTSNTSTPYTFIDNNAYYDGTNNIYIVNNRGAARYQQVNNEHRWELAPSGTAGNAISFTQAMTLFANGNLAVGTTTDAGYKLQVNSTSGDGMFLTSYLTTSGAADTGAILGFGIYDGVNNRDAAIIKGLKENGTSGNYAAYLSFSTRPNGGSVTERMRITSGGDVLIGATSIFNDGKVCISADATRVTIASKVSASTGAEHIRFINPNGVVGYISTSGTVTTYSITSDYRLKQDLKDYKGLELISAIKTYDYEWKADNSRMYGVMAHELAEVLPYSVSGEKDELDKDGNPKMQGVDYSKLVPILVKAVQELEARIKQLENK
jgi:hypothetical protein